MKKYRDYRDLTAEELRLLREYAKSRGRYWKERLRQDWDSGKFSGPVYALRNSHGPMWLSKYRLPSEDELNRARQNFEEKYPTIKEWKKQIEGEIK